MRRFLAAAVALAFLSGCSIARPASEDLAGLGAGIIVGGITANPWIGVAAGVGARFTAGAVIDTAERDIEETIRKEIATAAGFSEVGALVPWSATHALLPYRIEGNLEVVRDFGRKLKCREIIYTIVSRGFSDERLKDPEFQVGTICRHNGNWKWVYKTPKTLSDPAF